MDTQWSFFFMPSLSSVFPRFPLDLNPVCIPQDPDTQLQFVLSILRSLRAHSREGVADVCLANCCRKRSPFAFVPHSHVVLPRIQEILSQLQAQGRVRRSAEGRWVYLERRGQGHRTADAVLAAAEIGEAEGLVEPGGVCQPDQDQNVVTDADTSMVEGQDVGVDEPLTRACVDEPVLENGDMEDITAEEGVHGGGQEEGQEELGSDGSREAQLDVAEQETGVQDAEAEV